MIHGEHTENYNSLYTTLTKTEGGYGATAALVSRAEAGTPKQALMLALALLVCEWESRTGRETWRRPGARDRRYLAALVEWGYQPSDVERIVLTPPAAPTDDPTDTPASVPADLDTETDDGGGGDGDGEVDTGLSHADLDADTSDDGALDTETGDGVVDAEGWDPEGSEPEGFEAEAGQGYRDV